VLKVFLIDERAVVREIYTTSYLFPEVILNDIKTLRLENGARRRAGP
jgi:protein SCO1